MVSRYALSSVRRFSVLTRALQAIHDLSVYQPATFVSPFCAMLPSILENLVAATLPLRNQACHALGGFVLGLVSLPCSVTRAHAADQVAHFLTHIPARTTRAGSASPLKENASESFIVRTLRTTMAATEVSVAAQGPVWALCALASMIVLLGSRLKYDTKVSRIIIALLTAAKKSKKSSVRGMASLVWRCVTWAYFVPEPPALDDDDDMSTQNKGGDPFWKHVKNVVDLGAGQATLVGLFATHRVEGHGSDGKHLTRAFEMLKTMITKGGPTCGEGMEVLRVLVSEPDYVEKQAAPEEWNVNALLAKGLFSAVPGLLTADFKNLAPAVRLVYDRCPAVDDLIKPLTRGEIVHSDTFASLVELWREGLMGVDWTNSAETPVSNPFSSFAVLRNRLTGSVAGGRSRYLVQFDHRKRVRNHRRTQLGVRRHCCGYPSRYPAGSEFRPPAEIRPITWSRAWQ